MVQIRSKVDNRSLGFTGTPTSGTPLIVVDDDNAKTWQVICANEPEYQYDHLVQSWCPPLTSISFDSFIVPGTSSPPLVIQFPRNNLQAGTTAELGQMLPGEGINQVWLVVPRESLSQQSSCSNSILEQRGNWIVVMSGWQSRSDCPYS